MQLHAKRTVHVIAKTRLHLQGLVHLSALATLNAMPQSVLAAGLPRVYERNLPPDEQNINEAITAPPPPSKRWKFGTIVPPSFRESSSRNNNVFGGDRETTTRTQADKWGGVESVTEHRQRNVLGGEQQFRRERKQLPTGRVEATTSNTEIDVWGGRRKTKTSDERQVTGTVVRKAESEESDVWGGRRKTNTRDERQFTGTVVRNADSEENNLLGSATSSVSSSQNIMGGGTEEVKQERQNILKMQRKLEQTRSVSAVGRVKEKVVISHKTPLGISFKKEEDRHYVLPGAPRPAAGDRNTPTTIVTAPRIQRGSRLWGSGRQGSSTVIVTIPYDNSAPGGQQQGPQSLQHPASSQGRDLMQRVINIFNPSARGRRVGRDNGQLTSVRRRSTSPTPSAPWGRDGVNRPQSLSPLGRRNSVVRDPFRDHREDRHDLPSVGVWSEDGNRAETYTPSSAAGRLSRLWRGRTRRQQPDLTENLVRTFRFQIQ